MSHLLLLAVIVALVAGALGARVRLAAEGGDELHLAHLHPPRRLGAAAGPRRGARGAPPSPLVTTTAALGGSTCLGCQGGEKLNE